MPCSIIVLIDDDYLQRTVTSEELTGAFLGANLIAPETWEATEEALRAAPEDAIIVCDGILWDGRTAADVYSILADRGMTTRAVLYASGEGLRHAQFPFIVPKPNLRLLIPKMLQIAT